MKIQSSMLVLLFLVSCGYAARDTEAVGQVKRIVHNTPLLCPDYFEVDLSMGILRNGTGSMSNEDLFAVVESESDKNLLRAASENGKPVRLIYDVQRLVLCKDDELVVTKVEILNN